MLLLPRAGLIISVLLLCGYSPGLRADVPIVIETEIGAMEAVLFDQQAPRTVENILKYVDAKALDGAEFSRTVRSNPDNQPQSPVKIDVIQLRQGVPERLSLPPVALERTRDTKLRHQNGALSMARSEPDSATSSFSIAIGDQPELDFGGKRNTDGQGFAVFGRIVSGMGVAEKIHKSPASPTGSREGVLAGDQSLSPPIKIISIRRKQ